MSQNTRTESKEYDELHEQIIRGNLRILKQELVHILYKQYIEQLRTIQDTCSDHQYDDKTKKRIAELFEKQKDFSSIDQYAKEIAHIEPIIKNNPVVEALEKDDDIRKIFKSHYIIYLSQYTYEVQHSVTEKNHYKIINNLFFNKKKDTQIPELVVVKNLTDEGYVGQCNLSTNFSSTDISNTNSIQYHTGLQKEDFLYLHKLDDLYKKKVSKNQLFPVTTPRNQALVNELFQNAQTSTAQNNINPPVKENPIAQEPKRYPIEKNHNNFMNGSLDVKLKFKIDYAKEYLDRTYIDEDHEPDVQRLTFEDPGKKICLVKLSKNFKVVVLGYNTGKIKVYYLNEEPEIHTEEAKDKDQVNEAGENVSENNDGNLINRRDEEVVMGELQMNAEVKNRIDNEDLLNAKPKDFEYNMRCKSYYGHSAPITCIDLNYDDEFMISSSVDCTVRLWNLVLGQCLSIYKMHLRTIWSTAFCPKGAHFASGGADNIIYVWSTNKQFPIMNLIGHSSDVVGLEFTYNMVYLCSNSLDKTFRIWDLGDGSLVRILFFEEIITAFEISLNADLLIAGSEDGTIYIWDLYKPLKIHSFNLMDEKSNKNASTSSNGVPYLNATSQKKTSKFAKKIRSIKFTADEKYVIINNKNKLAYYSTQSFKEERSKNVYEKYGSNQDCNSMTNYIEPINFLSSPHLNILCNQPTIKNVITCACISYDHES